MAKTDEPADDFMGLFEEFGENGGEVGTVDDESKVAKRAKWLNRFVYAHSPIDDEAVAALAGLNESRAMELFKEIELKADQIHNPSGYLKKAVERESTSSADRGASSMLAEYQKVQKHAWWMSNHLFVENKISDDAVIAVSRLGVPRAMALFKEMEQKADQIKNPSGYIKSAVMREGSQPASVSGGAGSGTSYDKVSKRAYWLNKNVFLECPIDDKTVAAMASLETSRAMELFKEIEMKADQIKNANSYLKTAIMWEDHIPDIFEGGGIPGIEGAGGYEKVSKRAHWLNKNVFVANPINDEAIAALNSLGVSRAMELFKDIEQKGDEVQNPSGYLKAAAAREGVGGQHAASNNQGMGAAVSYDKTSKRVYWLNKNVFTESPIDDGALAAINALGESRAMELLKEIEQKGSQIKNPSSYLKAAAAREGYAQGPVFGIFPRHDGNTGSSYDKVSKRAHWLSNNVFVAKPISPEAVAAMSSLDQTRAMELFKEIEQKGEQITNPSGYLIQAVTREGQNAGGTCGKGIKIIGATSRQAVASNFLMPKIPAYLPPAHLLAPSRGIPSGNDNDTVRKRATWLNHNVFADNPIDDETVAVMVGLGHARAMELFKEVEGKAAQMTNPSGWLWKAATNGQGRGIKRAAP